ncbi:MAG TPA: PASTA domain-containing protein [Amycolatopsis sp.]|uniref:PASTA domain-containing protein n=1 Tax=Amycolatopsis sp. TaxID=37632 RepID=UPI002F421F62
MSRRMVKALAVLALVPVACGAPPGEPGTTTAVKTSTSTSAPAKLIKVPDVSGMNHQDAQNAMQRAGLYNLREVDGTGQGRALVIDRNWVQTGQDPAPGTEVAPDAVITLTAVKYDDR